MSVTTKKTQTEIWIENLVILNQIVGDVVLLVYHESDNVGIYLDYELTIELDEGTAIKLKN
jgi:hypothetical protein